MQFQNQRSSLWIPSKGHVSVRQIQMDHQVKQVYFIFEDLEVQNRLKTKQQQLTKSWPFLKFEHL